MNILIYKIGKVLKREKHKIRVNFFFKLSNILAVLLKIIIMIYYFKSILAALPSNQDCSCLDMTTLGRCKALMLKISKFLKIINGHST